MLVPYYQEKMEAIDSFLQFAEGNGMPAWPLEIFLEISNVCNLRCAMCDTFSTLNTARQKKIQSIERGFLNVKALSTSLEPLLMHSLQVHAFGGGEPTIHPHFRDIIDYLSKYGVMVDFFTNGMRLDKDLSAFLVDRKVTKFTLSMSGANKTDYESIYVGGDFNTIIENLRNLQKIKKERDTAYPIVEVNSIAFVHHVDKFIDFVTLMGECGVRVIHLKPLFIYDAIRQLHGHVSIPRMEVEIPMLERAREIAGAYGMIIASRPYENTATVSKTGTAVVNNTSSVSTIVPLSVIAETARMSDVNKLQQHEVKIKQAKYLDPETMGLLACEGIPCLEPFKTLFVSNSGDVFPCCFRSSEYALGTMPSDDGPSIWRNRAFAAVRKNIVRSNQYPSEMCGRCLKVNQYPQGHAVGYRVNTFHQWCMAVYGDGFPRELLTRAVSLPPNAKILAAHGGAST